MKEIKDAGGEAIANGASVTDDAGVAHLVKQTMDTWGRIDILIANAGILRDKSFAKMEIKDFEAVMNVHLMGTVKPAKAIWQIMREQKYGRIVVTTSSTGLYGNFGQTNYGAAKLSLVGFMNSLKLEGAKDNIKVNAICPVAATRMTENLMPPAVIEMLKPEYVTPGRGLSWHRRRAHRHDPHRRRRRVRRRPDWWRPTASISATRRRATTWRRISPRSPISPTPSITPRAANRTRNSLPASRIRLP